MRLSKTLALSCLLLLLSAFLPVAAESQPQRPFGIGHKTFLLHGKPFVIKAAELHYPRIPRPYWEHRIKMCKALGMNTICLYVFWNIHEQREGVFDFTGQNDVAAFCRLAHKHGLYVIVRPGPYVCAEWEMGGLPWWLLKKKDIRLRQSDPYFMERVRLFEQEVGKQLAPLTIERGGPIIMVQIENEYGAYGEDKAYISAIRDIVRASGFSDVTLFQCDWASNFTKNGLDDLVWTMNFGTGANIDEQFRRLAELRPDAPLMCSEFWSGWFDKWGVRHETRPAAQMVAGIDEMLSKGISFSLYMTHGGTSFGHWAGANSPSYAPDVTSYDYDAPINEYGLPTEKYHLLRQTLQKYASRPLPSVPAPAAPLIEVPRFALTEYVPLVNGIDRVVESRETQTLEALDMGFGSVLYETTLPALPAGALLQVSDVHDYALIYIDGQYVGKLNRMKNEKSIALPVVREGAKLSIWVEAMGRVNFGWAIKDFKGITNGVTVTTAQGGHELTYALKNWSISTLPDDYATARAAFAKPTATPRFQSTAGYYRGHFVLAKTGDTFLNMEAFGKGQVYVNGHAIGRFWHIGPQQTLYVPGCWLKKGKNEVIILEVEGLQGSPFAFGQRTPELDKLNLQRDSHRQTVQLDESKLIKAGTFSAGNGWQSVSFGQAYTGRYLALQALSTHQQSNEVAVAELYALGADGKRLSREPWTIKSVSSENTAQGNNMATKVYDLQESTYWRTAAGVKSPHLIVIDLGSVQTLTGIDYLPRAEQGAPEGIKGYKVYLWGE